MKPPEPETYLLILRPLPSHTPSVQRLRLLLKIALRAFALKAERVTVGPRDAAPRLLDRQPSADVSLENAKRRVS